MGTYEKQVAEFKYVAKQVADLLKKSPRTVEKQIATLKKNGFIEYRNSDKTGGYYPL